MLAATVGEYGPQYNDGAGGGGGGAAAVGTNAEYFRGHRHCWKRWSWLR